MGFFPLLRLKKILCEINMEPEKKTVREARIQNISRYVGDLRSQTGYYLDWIPEYNESLASADNFYEIIRKDEQIARCSNLLALRVAGDRLSVRAKNNTLKALTLFALSEIRDFPHARKSLVEKTCVFGLGIQKKYYEKVEYGGLEWQTCVKLQEVDRRRLRIEKVLGTQEQYWTIWHPKLDKYIVLDDLETVPDSPHSLQDYVWYVSNWEEMAPYFEGFGDTLYRLAYIKSNCLKYWASLAESWSGPHAIAKVSFLKKTVANAQNTGMVDQATRVKGIQDAIEKSMARHVTVMDEDDDIKFFEHGNSGSNIIHQLIEYCDLRIEHLFFGTETAIGSVGGRGSYALARTQVPEKDCIISYNRARLEETLLREVVMDFFYRNRKNLAALNVEMPRWSDIRLEINTQAAIEQRQMMQAEQDNPQEIADGH